LKHFKITQIAKKHILLGNLAAWYSGRWWQWQ